jgi:NADPH2:quinone reductase
MTDRSVTCYDFEIYSADRVPQRQPNRSRRNHREGAAAMKAAVIEKVGAAPLATVLADPSPATDTQVVLQVEATALNQIDVYIAQGRHPAGPPEIPYVPAVEVVGTIVAGPDQGLRVHATVPAGLAPGVSGGLAELLLIERAACVPVPDALDSVVAAAIGVVGIGAVLALGKADLQAGESVLVLGATGPFGATVVQVAKLAGAGRVIAAGRNPERLAHVRGADAVVVLGAQPPSEQLALLGGPVDLVADPLWGPWAVPALACLRPGGRYLSIGGAAGDAPDFRVVMLRSAQLTLIGFSGLTAKPADVRAGYNRIAALSAAGSFQLPTATYPLEEAALAWEAQASSPGKKIVVVP